ncbi:MAG: nucleotidyltransferase domain-containing protein [Deltaproteobacteria bacterium]|nr:MAG: nucleotidyltransferase domain-containing protein [Deltaproteobacteria bacterium]
MLQKLFSSRVRVKLLNQFITSPEGRFYIRELERLTGEDYKSIVMELHNLESLGLLKGEAQGNLKYYSIDRNFFLFPELKNIIFKTAGVKGALEQELKKIKGIMYAFIYGSYAKGKEDPRSDIDLMVIGDIEIGRLIASLRGPERDLQRKINYVVFDLPEIKKRFKIKDDFVREVFKDEKVMLIGEEDELRRITQRRVN